jgi:hypothetical protein
MKHGDDTPLFKRHVLILAPGGEVDIPAPCCTWARFAVVSLIRVRTDAAPTVGDVLSFRLLRDPVSQDLIAGETKAINFVTVALDRANGVESRDQRVSEGGTNGLRIRNTMDVKIAELIVQWEPYTLHNKVIA